MDLQPMIFQTDLCLRVFSGVVTLQRSILTLYFNLHLKTWYLHKIIRLILSEGIVFIKKLCGSVSSTQPLSSCFQWNPRDLLRLFVCLFFFFWLRKIPLEVHWSQCLWWTMVNGPSLSKSFFYLNIRIFCDEILPWLPLFRAQKKNP